MAGREMAFLDFEESQSEESQDEEDPGSHGLFRTHDHQLAFDEVFSEEQETIQQQHAERASDGQSRQKFCLAFSGGGIRAAAFQAGVLWRLAREDRLKDVEYFTAVSGGGYITSAFASHCLGMDQPEDGEAIRDWYVKVVARTILRMQHNSGDFVRDCFKAPCGNENGSSCLPRILDLPILLCTLFVTMSVNPVMFVIAVMVPFTVALNMYFGGAMRAAFCYPRPFTWEWFSLLQEYSYLRYLWQLFYVLAAFFFVFRVVKALLPPCKLQPTDAPPTNGRPARPHASTLNLIGHSTNACLQRALWWLLFLMAFIIFVPGLQVLVYGIKYSERQPYCADYMEKQHRLFQECSDRSLLGHHAFGQPWFNDTLFADYNRSTAIATASPSQDTEKPSLFQAEFARNGLFSLFVAFILVTMTVTIVVIPILGPALFMRFAMVLGPLALAVMMIAMVQFAVFGPVTLNVKGNLPYQGELWESFVSFCLVLALLLLPFYEDLRAILHSYYRRSLQGNFFCRGEDVSVTELKNNPYCPFVILTGTSSDYKPPGDKDTISELSFSPLHFGGEETGYVHMPYYRQLSKITAITGAGCLDAISLSMNDALSMRFWLEVLNLSWGDYLIFDHYSHLSKWLSACGNAKMQGFCFKTLHRLPGGLLWAAIFIMLNIAWQTSVLDPEACEFSQKLMLTAVIIVAAVFAMSFFAFVPFVDLLTLSPLIRQVHQATKYFYTGRRPPRMLYMTDGGVKDCTSLVQLLWRRRERILLVLAAADPHDDLGVLKAAFAVARELRLATFFDPRDPRRDVECLLNDFKEDPELTHMHIGISYCWEDATKNGPMRTGNLYIVKNRLPASFKGRRVARPLSLAELLGEEEEDSDDDDEDDENIPAKVFEPNEWEELTTDQLGPFGCCDCCHTKGLNCGPKFPHGTFTGYLYLTPQWFSSLCRLGYELCGSAIMEVTRPQSEQYL